jgi:hypothetical protein
VGAVAQAVLLGRAAALLFTVRHGTQDLKADLLKELNIALGVTPGDKNAGWKTVMLSDLIIEEAHLMVFDYLP